MGVGPETIVGVALEASVDAIVGILGILKAGGAYFPLDLGYPSERVAFLLLALFYKARGLGLVADNSVVFPFTQQHVADTLGMSLVHTNKTLQRLTATKAMRWKERRFDLLDREALATIANYERSEPRARRPFI